MVSVGDKRVKMEALANKEDMITGVGSAVQGK